MSKELVEKAREFIHSEAMDVGRDDDLSGLKVAGCCLPDLLADFAAQAIREREAEIAAKLSNIRNEATHDVQDAISSLEGLISRLESGKERE